MRIIAGIVVMLAGVAMAQEVPKPSPPQKEHEWLKQLAGEWVTDGEGIVAPNQPPIRCQGTESAKLLGGLWAVSEMKGEFMGTVVTGMLTIGFDTQKKKFVGSWVCSMHDAMIKYEGTLDGQVLTLECEAPHPGTGKPTKMRDVIEIKDKNNKVMKSLMQGDDGKWIQFMTMTAKRKS